MLYIATFDWAVAGLGALSAALGAGLFWQVLRRRDTQALLDARDLQLEQQRDANLAQTLELGELNAALRASRQQAGDLTQLREDARQAQVQATQAHGRASAAEAQMGQLLEQHHELKGIQARLQAAYEGLQAQHAELAREHATLSNTLAHKQQHFDEQQQLLKDSRDQLKLEFEQLAGQIFEAKGQAFSQHSQQSLDALLKPFREQIEGFRAKVEDIHHKDVQQQAALAQELLHLKELNRQITQEAHDLTTALKGQKKAQGNWGELILENVLERSGLVLGRDFKREVSLQGEHGRQRPDAIVYLPQGKHLIIDAKVSLNAYVRYINAEDETERRLALSEHVSAVAARIKELSDRHYFQLPGLNAPEMVFMFVPIESAFVEALKADETLFQKAIEQNVLVATPTTLLTSLNIVRQLWRFEDQNKHSAELAERAGRVYDKLRTFLGSMDTVGASLEKAQDAYRRACDQLVSGRGNLVKQVSDFQQLGVAVKAELSGEWAERADLELERLAGERP
ncbi:MULTISPECIES: DNA recombination protein RmuC [unclassified Pseudomonas]|uniref:DNA recombination protein RmuC n=1 Tax=unclassified Pseudomonas TaxID=196821 RepID=UPI000BD3D3FD|nr:MULTISPECIES: DNA recombination protein RmuC [unclassified Pseudomonas]PVZ15925.1 DNA recombination protein RmuC [Pseudomonas sp. URIL14HWK12:I12]PVZ26219.1 DNA recombination protein RmuC [Pseudomonas sp. URIL14HWK12:I10]PVZ36257.1 DNA recombination protein RmuC [Pseudomonas sp. URIL14HWK12:I11]SNZ18263.1 DNA recombination protein RmuC [Pseudomonas sp. URIL14HWK12:I9]